MKKYNTLFVIIFTVLFLVLLTWLLPVTYLNGEFVSDVRSQVGLADLFTYPTYLIYNFIYIFIYVILVGGFYGVLNKTGAYRQLLDKIVNFLKGKEIVFGSITVLLLSTIVSFTGFTFEAILFFPFIIAIVLLLGHDKIVASLMTLGPVITGIMGSTFSKLVNGTFNGVLNASSSIVNYTDLIWFKVGLLLVANIILILNIVFYARKHKDTTTVVEENIFVPSVNEEEPKKLWPMITIFVITLLLIIVGSINWEGAFGVTLFVDYLDKFNTTFTIGGYPVVPKIVGTLVAFGNWSYNEYMVLIFIITLLFKLIYRVKFEELFDSLFDGAKNYLYAAGIMLFSYTVLIVTSNHPVLLTILKPLLEITDGFNSVTLSLGTFISALFNTDFTYYGYSILSLNYVTAYINDTSVYALCGLITQAIYGIAMLVAPTSIVLLFNLSSLKITYWEWLKNIWKLFVELLLISFALFTIILLII